MKLKEATNTKMKVFGEFEGVRLIFQGEESSKGRSVYADIVMDERNTENLIEMLRQGMAVHKGIRALTSKSVAEA